MRAARAITSRAHPLWVAYVVHRLSGLGLALFLPLHFWVLALAMTDPERLDGFLHLTEAGAIKLAEFGLVFLLSVHMFGGLRLMAMEWLPDPGAQPLTWLLDALQGAGYSGDEPLMAEGMARLIALQHENGTWPDPHVHVETTVTALRLLVGYDAGPG